VQESWNEFYVAREDVACTKQRTAFSALLFDSRVALSGNSSVQSSVRLAPCLSELEEEGGHLAIPQRGANISRNPAVRILNNVEGRQDSRIGSLREIVKS